jgi:N-acetylneuraminic acid mutarotase
VIGGLDGRIYVMGGYSSASSGPNSTARAYDPRTDSWTTLTSMSTPTRGSGIAVDQSGLIYVISGYSSGDINNVQRYDPSSDSWAAGTPIPTPIWMPGATTGTDGRIYVAGGETGSTASTLLQIYNPLTKTWSSGTPMSMSRKQFQAVAAPNGLIYAIGGLNSSGIATATVEAYNITSNAWSAKASLPSAVMVFGATLGPDGLIYVFGGSNVYYNNNAPFYGEVYSYDPLGNQWYNNTETLPTPRRELSAATSSYNGRIYVIGGANGTYLTTNEEATLPASYTPPPPPPSNPAPVASITSTTPNPALTGQAVTFVGSGSDNDGDTIIAYNWRDSINGTIGTQATITTKNLPAGTHTIYFSVEDNHGIWSSEVSTVLTIEPGFLGLPTFDWTMLVLALVGVGVFIGYLVMFKKKRHNSGPVVPTATLGLASP